MTENSQVISFLLNPEIDDERLALEFLERRAQAGEKTRQVIVQALLRLDDQQPTQRPSDLVEELRATLKESRELIETLRAGGAAPLPNGHDQPPAAQDELQPEMRAAIRKAARPGLKVGQVVEASHGRKI